MALLLATLAVAATVPSLGLLAPSPWSQTQPWLTSAPHNAAPTHYAHDTSGIYSVHSSMAPLPLPPSFSISPPTPARTSHPNYPDVSAQDYPFSSCTSISTVEYNQEANHKKFHTKETNPTSVPATSQSLLPPPPQTHSSYHPVSAHCSSHPPSSPSHPQLHSSIPAPATNPPPSTT